MKIVHIVAQGPFTEEMTYQENILPQCQSAVGNEVTIIANCTYWDKSTIQYTSPLTKVMDSGVKLIRLPFKRIINAYFSEKLRYLVGFKKVLTDESPDFIFLHDLSTGVTGELRSYMKDHPKVTLVIDCHTTFTNSGKTFISLKILHGIIYRYFGHQVCDYASKIYYVGLESKRFLETIYKIEGDKLDYLPLGGIILDQEEYENRRRRIRELYNIPSDQTVFLHSGKLDAPKKTIEIIKAFIKRSQKESSVLYIIGDTEDLERKKSIMKLIFQDERIYFLGWKSGAELLDFLCATDVYLQPGTPSATLQLAACNRCGVIIKDYEDYKCLFDVGEVFIHSEEDLVNKIDTLSKSSIEVQILKECTFKVAMKKLDYRMQSNTILAENNK